MEWFEVEDVVVDCVKKRLGQKFEENPAKFTRDFGKAYKQLKPSFGNPNYSLPLTGGAYALKYHLQRMDNMRLALRTVHSVFPLRILKIREYWILVAALERVPLQ